MSPWLLFISLTASGCTSGRFVIDTPPPPATSGIVIEDRRPANDREWHRPELSLPKPAKVFLPIDYFGDNNFSPDRLTLLKNKLATLIPAEHQSKPVVLTRFDVIDYYPVRSGQATADGAYSPAARIYDGKRSHSYDAYICIFEASLGEVTERVAMEVPWTAQNDSLTIFNDSKSVAAINSLIDSTLQAWVKKVLGEEAPVPGGDVRALGGNR